LLGRLDGILTGIRQLRRVRPLETESIAGLRVPTLNETAQAFDLRQSQALWNRENLDLASDEILAQFLDLGELEAWREIYRRAAAPTDEGAALRRHIVFLCCTVPVAFPHLFLAAMAHLGEVVDPYPNVPVDGVAT
jgi:hypothetical protein